MPPTVHRSRLLPSLILAWGLSLPCAPAQATLPAAEREALVDLYVQTDGPGWHQHAGWLQGDPCLQAWHGVRCTPQNDAVTGLLLPLNRLQGPLPASLARLSRLETVDLQGNDGLYGRLPDLRQWPDLVVFRAGFNQFEGALPVLSGLPRLERLDLGNNLLGGPLPSALELPALKELRLNHNRFKGRLPVITHSVALEIVDFSFNQLQGPLPPLDRLPRLQLFNSEWNAHQGTIPALKGLTQLQGLVLSGNRLVGPIPDLSGLDGLQLLVLDHNHLSGPVPPLASLQNLSLLDLSHNRLAGPYPALAELPALTHVRLDHNRFEGRAPSPPPGLSMALRCADDETQPHEKARSADDLPCLRTEPYFTPLPRPLAGQTEPPARHTGRPETATLAATAQASRLDPTGPTLWPPSPQLLLAMGGLALWMGLLRWWWQRRPQAHP